MKPQTVVLLFSVLQILILEMSKAMSAPSTGGQPQFPYRFMSTILHENDGVGVKYRVQARNVNSFYMHLEPMNERVNGKEMIRASSLVADAVAINPTTGAISLTKALDFESFGLPPRQAYLNVLFYVFAEGGAPLENATARFTLTIMDVNDNSPVFSSSTPKETTLVNTVPVGTEVIKVVATDTDHGLNGEVAYAMNVSIGREPSRAFGINASTGQIYVAGSLYSKAIQDEYDLHIVAHDRARAVRKQTQMDLKLFVQQPGETSHEVDFKNIHRLQEKNQEIHPHFENERKQRNEEDF